MKHKKIPTCVGIPRETRHAGWLLDTVYDSRLFFVDILAEVGA